MTRQLSYLSVLILLAAVVGLAGCSGLVQVVDPDGRPVAGAEVTAVSLSMTAGPNITDGQGEAYLPGNIQDVQWVQVAKPWHRTVQVDLPETWPLRVMLVPTPGSRRP